MPKAYIGTSGYNYKHWRGVFYPKDLSQKQWLEFYNKFFDTVELNVTFYRLPLESVFKNWFKTTSDNFLFTVKGSRFITHVKRLNDVKEPLKLFLKRAENLQEKLGMVLWQLPPRFKADPERLEKFCEMLRSATPVRVGDPTPGDPSAAAEPPNVLGIASLRHAFEFRDESWFSEEIYSILKKYNMSLVICDYPFNLVSSGQKIQNNRKVIQVPETADFIYLRRHGATALYASNYSDEQLEGDAEQIKKWLKNGKDVYVYFNNDAHGFAIKNALKLKELIRCNKLK